MLLCYSPQSKRAFKPILGQPLFLGRQVINRQPQIVGMFKHWHQLFSLRQRHLPFAWGASRFFNPLVHGVHDRPCEVRLGIRKPALVVRAGGFGQRQESFRLKVWEQHATLPGRSGLDEELGQHAGQWHVLNDVVLSFL